MSLSLFCLKCKLCKSQKTPGSQNAEKDHFPFFRFTFGTPKNLGPMAKTKTSVFIEKFGLCGDRKSNRRHLSLGLPNFSSSASELPHFCSQLKLNVCNRSFLVHPLMSRTRTHMYPCVLALTLTLTLTLTHKYPCALALTLTHIY